MRFETTQEFPNESAEAVLRVLEVSLRHRFPDVMRSGSEIVLHGLGPSPQAVNTRDTAVFRVTSNGKGVLLQEEISFQASALLGGASQREIVRSKLDQIFEEMRTELRFAKRNTGGDSGRFAVGVMETAAGTKSLAPGASVDEGPRGKKTAVGEAEGKIKLQGRRAPAAVGALTATMLLVVNLPQTMPFGVGYGPARPSAPVQKMQSTPEMDINATWNDRAETDPRLWLDGWAKATRGRDAAEQASFYADEVSPYLGRKDVSREQILVDKRASILNRKGLWTVRLDHVSVERADADHATVRFSKHYMDQVQEGEVAERIFQTRMGIARVGGEWKIVSEQDVAAVPVRPVEGLR